MTTTTLSAPVSRIKKLAEVPLDKIDGFAAGNPRVMQAGMKAVLHSSLHEFGVVEPIIVREGKTKGRYEILNGHHRYDELKTSGAAKVHVVIVDVTDDTQAKALVLALNRISADWDYAGLTAYIDEMMAQDPSKATADWIVKTTGFTSVEIEQLAAAGTSFLDDMTAPPPGGTNETGHGPAAALPPSEFLNFSVSLTKEQNLTVLAALKQSKKKDGGTTADALARICETFTDTQAE